MALFKWGSVKKTYSIKNTAFLRVLLVYQSNKHKTFPFRNYESVLESFNLMYLPIQIMMVAKRRAVRKNALLLHKIFLFVLKLLLFIHRYVFFKTNIFLTSKKFQLGSSYAWHFSSKFIIIICTSIPYLSSNSSFM